MVGPKIIKTESDLVLELLKLLKHKEGYERELVYNPDGALRPLALGYVRGWPFSDFSINLEFRGQKTWLTGRSLGGVIDAAQKIDYLSRLP